MQATKNIDAWRVFTAVAEGGGIRRASEETGLDFPACTRLLQKLESELGVVLINHHVRPVRLTGFAEKLLPSAQQIVFSLNYVKELASSYNQSELLIHLGIPVNVPRKSVNGHIRTYERFDRALSVRVISDVDHQDILEGRADMALLPYRPPEEGLVLIPAGKAFNIPVASAAYLKTHPFPRTPEDLSKHLLILRSDRHYPLTTKLVRDGDERPLVCAGIAFSGDALSGFESLRNSEGIALDLSYSMCAKGIESGEFVPVLDGWHRPDWEMVVAVSKEKSGNERLLRFAKWFAKEERASMETRTRSFPVYPK